MEHSEGRIRRRVLRADVRARGFSYGRDDKGKPAVRIDFSKAGFLADDLLRTRFGTNLPVGKPGCAVYQPDLPRGQSLASLGASGVVFDTDEGFGRLGRAAELAGALGVDLLPLARFSAGEVRGRLFDEIPVGGDRP